MAHSIEDLRQAEKHLLEGRPAKMEIKGEDEGEQLTHVLAAIYILEQMEQNEYTFPEALRLYSQKVRATFS